MSVPSANRPWVVFADDWGRHPSSCQHLIRQVLPHRHIVWVNTIGTRPPRFDWASARRATGKLWEWVQPSRVRSNSRNHLPSPTVLAPKMWPSFSNHGGRILNRYLLTRALRGIVKGLNPTPTVITTLPLMADLIDAVPVHRWVYYCVDDFSVWPGYDGATMRRMEHDLVSRVDSIVCVSENLQEHIREMGRDAQLLTHGVDLSHWQVKPGDTLPAELIGLAPPFVLFWGVIDRRMDVAVLERISQRLGAGTMVLVGPQEDPDPALFRIPRLVVRPPVSFLRLPSLATAASVLLMPYAEIPATRAMQPLKLKEYLATGKPAVVRALPATQPWADTADLASTPDEFADLVNRRLHGEIPTDQLVARGRLWAESWAGKARIFEDFMEPGENHSPSPKQVIPM